MKLTTMLVSTGTIGVVTAGLVVSPALAWHPKGAIQKTVEDETTHSAAVDANEVNSALDVNTGDTLKYVITVSNNGAPAKNGDDDMANTVMTDTLPAGVVPVDSSTPSQIQVTMGTIKPGQSKTESYEVKVTAATDSQVITNEACYTGNSKVNDNPQQGCDDAVIKVHATTPPAPTQPSTPQQPANLPNTGAGNFVVPALAVSALGYAGYMLRLKFKRQA